MSKCNVTNNPRSKLYQTITLKPPTSYSRQSNTPGLVQEFYQTITLKPPISYSRQSNTPGLAQNSIKPLYQLAHTSYSMQSNTPSLVQEFYQTITKGRFFIAIAYCHTECT